MCDGAETRLLADAEQVRDEVEALWRFHTDRVRPQTPPLKLYDRAAFSQQPPWQVVQCVACTMVYRNPRERADALRATYGEETTEPDVLRTLLATQADSARAQLRRFARVAGDRGRGIEVGSYVGAFLSAARDAGWRFSGVDVNEQVNAFTRQQGFQVTTGEIDNVEDERVDAIAFWNCFDQMPDSRAAARAAHRRLKSGGTIVVRVPNGGFYAWLRPKLRGPSAPLARAMLAHNNLLAFPYRHGFTPRALRRLLADTGFTVIAVRGDTLVPIADKWTRKWAALEERLLKRVMRLAGSAGAPWPWLECYARRD